MQKFRAKQVVLVVAFKVKAIYIQPTFTFSKFSLEIPEQCVKPKCVFES